MSLQTGDVPEQWKIARVVPIFKKGDTDLISNYRPISVIPVLAKIVEKFVTKQTQKYLNDNGIYYDNQSGFRPLFSTNTALLNLSEDILESMNNGDVTGAVMLDVQKAFDSIDHFILLAKMGYVGMSPNVIKWFRSYLSSRKQYVVLNGVKSDIMEVSCGIPQGSALGPLLFAIYVNDLHTAVRQSRVQLYADDTCLYYSAKMLAQLKLPSMKI